MAATQKVMEQLLDGNGEALRLSGELVIAKNKGETFAQHAADTTRHLTTAQVDTAIETALAPIQKELDQVTSGGTGGGGDSLKVGDILLTANPKRDVSSFLPADGSRIRAESYPNLGQVLGTEGVPESVPESISFTLKFEELPSQGNNYHRLSRSADQFVASIRGHVSSQVKTYRVSKDGISWIQRTAPEVYTDICYLNGEWICACKSKLYTSSSADLGWSKRCDFPWAATDHSGNIYHMGYGNGIYFCAPQSAQQVYISTDGMKTWTSRSAQGARNPIHCAYKDGCYMLFETGYSLNGRMYYSTDKGETWTSKELPLKFDNTTYGMSLLERDGKLYLLGQGAIAISTDLPTWEVYPVEVTTGSTTTTYTGTIVYAEGLFIASSDASRYATYAVSTDGLQWTPAPMNLPSPAKDAMGTGDGIIILSCGVLASSSTMKGVLYIAQPSLNTKYYLTLPKVTCPGAKAYVKAL